MLPLTRYKEYYQALGAVPGLRPLFISQTIFLATYFMFNALVTGCYISMQPQPAWQKVIVLLSDLLVGGLFAVQCLLLLLAGPVRWRWLLALVSGGCLATVSCASLLLITERDVLDIQHRLAQAEPVAVRSITTQASGDVAFVFQQGPSPVFTGIFVVALSAALAGLPVIVTVRFLNTTSYHQYTSYYQISEAIK